jgi:hypothetical protein
MPRYGL